MSDCRFIYYSPLHEAAGPPKNGMPHVGRNVDHTMVTSFTAIVYLFPILSKTFESLLEFGGVLACAAALGSRVYCDMERGDDPINSENNFVKSFW